MSDIQIDMERRPNHATRTRATLVGPLLLALLAGCSSHSADDKLSSELARLRREHEAIKRELALLRAERDHPLAPRVAERRTARPSAAAPRTHLALVDLLDAYRVALESEDLEFMRDEIYGGDLPAEDSRYLEIWFERTEGLEVELEPRGFQVDDGRARAVVEQTMSYRLSRTHEKRTVRLELRMHFERRGDTWLVRKVNTRL